MSTPATSRIIAALAAAALAAGATATAASAAVNSANGGPCDTKSHGGPGGNSGPGNGGPVMPPPPPPPPPGTPIICVGFDDHHHHSPPPPPPPPPPLILPASTPVNTAATTNTTPAPVIVVSPQNTLPQQPAANTVANTTPAPALRMGRLAGLELANWSDDGVLALEATCGNGAGSCAGTLRFRTTRHRHHHTRTVVLGSRTFEIAAGQSALVQVKLASSARGLLARSGILKITAVTLSGQTTKRAFDV